MLTITETAGVVVKTIATQAPDTENSGLRISGTDADAPDLMVAVAAAPEPDDQIVERDGARVFLERTAAAMLDDKILDAHVQADGSVAFAIADQNG